MARTPWKNYRVSKGRINFCRRRFYKGFLMATIVPPVSRKQKRNNIEDEGKQCLHSHRNSIRTYRFLMKNGAVQIDAVKKRCIPFNCRFLCKQGGNVFAITSVTGNYLYADKKIRWKKFLKNCFCCRRQPVRNSGSSKTKDLAFHHGSGNW